MDVRRVGGRPTLTRGQAGFSLLESVVSIALVSVVILALATGLLTSIKTSASTRDTQRIDAVLSAFAEGYKVDVATTCPSTTATSVPGYIEEVTAVQSWDASANSGKGAWATCTAGTPGQAPYRLSLKVTADGTGDTVTGQVVVGAT